MYPLSIFSLAKEQRLRHLRILQIDYWNEQTLRNTAILRTTVLVAGKNGYESLITGSYLFYGMSALHPKAAIELVES